MQTDGTTIGFPVKERPEKEHKALGGETPGASGEVRRPPRPDVEGASYVTRTLSFFRTGKPGERQGGQEGGRFAWGILPGRIRIHL